MAAGLRQWQRVSTNPLSYKRLLTTRWYRSFHNQQGKKIGEPLRILFCGSDAFSVASLKALDRERVNNPELISSLDVVHRPAKRVGRGLKEFRNVPLRATAESLALPIHEVDTFTGWEPPRPHGKPINLVVAVSFGLLVPPRILNSCKYGGINVHPSMLPDLRGPAPLQHTLLLGRKKSGITVQTLHPHHFDRGQILAQTPFPGLTIPVVHDDPYTTLQNFLIPESSKLLLSTLRQYLFVPPITDVGWYGKERNDHEIAHAPKIIPEHRCIQWDSWTSDVIVRRSHILGTVWDDTTYARCAGNIEKTRRIKFHRCEIVENPVVNLQFSATPGSPVLSTVDGKTDLLIRTVQQKSFIRPLKCTIEGKGHGKGLHSLIALMESRKLASLIN